MYGKLFTVEQYNLSLMKKSVLVTDSFVCLKFFQEALVIELVCTNWLDSFVTVATMLTLCLLHYFIGYRLVDEFTATCLDMVTIIKIYSNHTPPYEHIFFRLNLIHGNTVQMYAKHCRQFVWN